MRSLSAVMFGAIGFLVGVAMQAPGGGVSFTDWRGPFASLAMSGFGAGTGSGLGLGDGRTLRHGISGALVGAGTGTILGVAGAGIAVCAAIALVLAVSMRR